MKHESFKKFHPTVNLIFYALVLGFSMATTHPLAQVILFICAFWHARLCCGKRAISMSLRFCLPMLLLALILNPAFNHEGATILLYLPSDNPLTLESILYGASAGLMLWTVLLWFLSFNEVMTTDKLIHLFGRAAPALSLLLSMTLRFVPRFKRQLSLVLDAQKALGKPAGKVKAAVSALSVTVTWALENAVDTADSMRSRGYGTGARSSYSNFRWTERDRWALAWLILCGAALVAAAVGGACGFGYFPAVHWAELNALGAAFYVLLAALSLTPVYLDKKEDRMWKALNLKM